MAFKIPFAYDPQGVLTRPDNASRGLTYACPACREVVIYRHGPSVSAHFSHKASQTCSAETVIHKGAKLLIERAIVDWIAGRTITPVIEDACSVCRTPMTRELPPDINHVCQEHRLSTGHVADVALLRDTVVELVVEIRVTHAVDEEKAFNIGIPFVELDGYELTSSKRPGRRRQIQFTDPSTPDRWQPLESSLPELHCHTCLERLPRYLTLLAKVAKACQLDVPTRYYRPGICSCWKCHRQIVVFAWPKPENHLAVAPPREPRPRTIRHRYSRTAETSYWLSVCPYCDAVQGDHYLYMEPDGAFWKLAQPLGDTDSAYIHDILTIAYFAEYNGLLSPPG